MNFELSHSDTQPIPNQWPPTEKISDPDTGNNPSSSFIPSVQVQTEEQAIRSIIAGNDPLEWPPLETTPIMNLTLKVWQPWLFQYYFPMAKEIQHV